MYYVWFIRSMVSKLISCAVCICQPRQSWVPCNGEAYIFFRILFVRARGKFRKSSHSWLVISIFLKFDSDSEFGRSWTENDCQQKEYIITNIYIITIIKYFFPSRRYTNFPKKMFNFELWRKNYKKMKFRLATLKKVVFDRKIVFRIVINLYNKKKKYLYKTYISLNYWKYVKTLKKLI